MRTSRVEMVVSPQEGGLIFKARNLNEERYIEVPLSPTRAFSFYQVLMGRRRSEMIRRTSNGKTVMFSIFPETEKQKEGEEVAEKETGYKIVHLKEVGEGEERKFVYSFGLPGQLLLAEEFRNALSEVLKNGGGIEIARDRLTLMVFGGRVRVIANGEVVKLKKKTITILRNAILSGSDIDLGDISIKKGHHFAKGTQLTPEQESDLKGLIEVLS